MIIFYFITGELFDAARGYTTEIQRALPEGTILGSQIGSIFGPIGTAAGAAIGGLVDLFAKIFNTPLNLLKK